MYREEFTRRWHEDQFPGEQGSRIPHQYGGNWREQLTGPKSQYTGQTPANANYLANGVPMPIQREGSLFGPAVRRNPLFNDIAETGFNENGFGRRSLAASENLGIDNVGYSGRRGERRPYDTSSAVAFPRNQPVHIYRGKTPSEPGVRPPSWEKPRHLESGSVDYMDRTEFRRQPRSVANSYLDLKGETVPSWIKTLEPTYTEADKTRRNSNTSQQDAKIKMSVGWFITIRVIIMCLVIWDLVNDWLLASSGPITFFGNTASSENVKCKQNAIVMKTFKLNVSEVDTSMCRKTNDVWTLTAVFALLGSLLAILQIVNIILEIIKRRRPQFFQILHGQSEICFVLFFEELPQCLLFTIYFFICDCRSLRSEVNLYSLLATISATVAVTLRYTSSFDSIANENGCCNLWWRCCCCRNTDYCCRLEGKECCCTCDMPCPLCCCTLRCNMCRFTPKTWCASLLKAFSCFCGCCSTEDDFYGVRLMNNMSLLILWVCLAFQIVIYYSIHV